MGIELEKMGCDSLGIKDMSGILQPRIAFDLVKELKRKVGIPITLHTHDTAGLGAASYLAAIDAGVDCVEVSIAPFANGTSQPDTQRMLALLEGHPRCPKFDTEKLAQLRTYFEGVYKELAKFTSPANERVDSDILIYQVPGGMLSNFRTQLKEQGMSERFDEVVREIPVVREALGWIPLVTPTSQIVGTQAMMNVKFGRWKMICQPAQDIALGKYGKTPGPIDPGCAGPGGKTFRQKARHGASGRFAGTRPGKISQAMRRKGPAGRTTKSSSFSRCSRSKSKPCSSRKPAAPAPAPAAGCGRSGSRPRQGNGRGKHLFVTLNGQRHDVMVETLEG